MITSVPLLFCILNYFLFIGSSQSIMNGDGI